MGIITNTSDRKRMQDTCRVTPMLHGSLIVLLNWSRLSF